MSFFLLPLSLWLIIASIACFLLSVLTVIWSSRKNPALSLHLLPQWHLFYPRRNQIRGSVAVVLFLTLLFASSYDLIRHSEERTTRHFFVLRDQILFVWLRQWKTPPLQQEIKDAFFAGPNNDVLTLKNELGSLQKGGLDEAGNTLYQFSTGKSSQSDWPLYHEFKVSREQTRTYRKRLGLPLEGPINVLVFFIESARAFELQHPSLGKSIFPRLQEVLSKHAINFTRAYSSSRESGQTVRGQFSTLCSFLPNIMGPATYIHYYSLRVRCLPRVFKEQNYQTIWLNAFNKHFHGKFMFESLHGMDQFYDEEYFRGKFPKDQMKAWGLLDRPFLEESLHILEEHARKGPFFAHTLTTSTHFPFKVSEQVDLPPDLTAQIKDNTLYHGFVNQFRYTDEAIGNFFEKFFQSPISDRTLVVLLGDHSTFVKPHHLEMSEERLFDSYFRIPLALITKNMPHPETLTHIVHQVDVAPTIARVVGIQTPVTWIGRGLLQGGTPWVYEAHGQLSYRTNERACYNLHDGKGKCFENFDSQEKQVPFSPKEAEFFRDVIAANRKAIVFNRVAPKKPNHY